MPKPNADDFLELSALMQHRIGVTDITEQYRRIGESLKELEHESNGTDAGDE